MYQAFFVLATITITLAAIIHFLKFNGCSSVEAGHISKHRCVEQVTACTSFTERLVELNGIIDAFMFN